MKIEVIMTEEIFRRFTMFDILKRRKMWRPSAIFAAIMCTSAVICYCMNHVKGANLLGTVLLVLGLGMPAVYFGTFFSSLKQQVLILDLARPKHVYTLELTTKGHGIAVSNETEHAEYEWKKVHHVYRDLTATYLFITPARGFILPHQCIEEGDDALWALIEKKIPENRRSDIRR